MKLHTIIPNTLYQRGEFAHVGEHELRSTVGPPKIVAIVGVAGKQSEVARKVFDWTYIYEPMPDSANFDPGQAMNLALRAYRIAQNARGAVLVHCHAGRNRSGLISALLVVLFTRLTGREAIEVVRRGRKNALANPHFVEFLERVRGFNPHSNKFEMIESVALLSGGER